MPTKPHSLHSLLTIENAKTTKGEKLGYLTGILYLAPANESKVMTTCQYASAGCKADCLFTAGRGVFREIRKARIKKTKWLARDYAGFLEQLRRDIRALIRKADREGLKPAVRLNGTSDLPKLAMQLCEEFPAVMFYDYSKLPRPYLRQRPNYSITFSHSETNFADCIDALEHGINVAVVFSTKKGLPFPETWHGYRVISGDDLDLRFLDAQPAGQRGNVIGLYAKGRARKDTSSGFVVNPSILVNIQPAPVAV